MYVTQILAEVNKAGHRVINTSHLSLIRVNRSMNPFLFLDNLEELTPSNEECKPFIFAAYTHWKRLNLILIQNRKLICTSHQEH